MAADQRFADLAQQLKAGLSAAEQALVDAAIAAPVRTGPSYGFEDVGSAAVAALTALAGIADPLRRVTAARAVIASLAAGSVDRIRAQRVPDEVMERSVTWSDTLYAFLTGDVPADYHFPHDSFMKDYRFVTAMTVPCGAQVVDLAERMGPKTILKLATSAPLRAIRAATGPWFRPHTESRYLTEFNEDGWTHCYGLMAQLLERHPSVRGMVATSWFYDPKLAEISPRLNYLRDFPVDNGAVLVAHGTTPFDIESATSTSPTRRKLYEEGKFTPVCHSVLWFRDEMLAWARGAGRL